MQPVSACGKRLAFDANIIGKRNRSIFVRAGAPHLSVRHRFSEKLASAGQWRVINDGDIAEADALGYLCSLAEPGKIQLRGLTPIFKLRPRRLCPRNQCKQSSND